MCAAAAARPARRPAAALGRAASCDDGEAAFAAWLASELRDAPGRRVYAEVFDDAVRCVVAWRRRYRGNPRLWKQLMRPERVVKELVECAPVIAAARALVHGHVLADGERFTVVDLCSGKGFLSMFLSEMLPAEKVAHCVLVDKAWPLHRASADGAAAAEPVQPRSQQINAAHIYGGHDGASYFEDWPVPLHTSKQNLKKPRTLRDVGEHLIDRAPGPCLLLGVHLCGTLSLKAIELFNRHPNARLLALKPCCLPNMAHADRDETFEIRSAVEIGSAGGVVHVFAAKDVCAHGSFRGRHDAWDGPPRAHLKPRFDAWARHLAAGVDAAPSGGRAALEHSAVQVDGGYQNAFIFGERGPTTAALWAALARARDAAVPEAVPEVLAE